MQRDREFQLLEINPEVEKQQNVPTIGSFQMQLNRIKTITTKMLSIQHGQERSESWTTGQGRPLKEAPSGRRNSGHPTSDDAVRDANRVSKSAAHQMVSPFNSSLPLVFTMNARLIWSCKRRRERRREVTIMSDDHCEYHSAQ